MLSLLLPCHTGVDLQAAEPRGACFAGSLTRYNYALTCLGCVDEFGHFAPCGFMVSSSEAAQPITIFISKVEEAARQLLADPSFQLRSFMIDKSAAEIRAIRDLPGERNILLCRFHMLQDWVRFLRSSKAGVAEGDRGAVVAALRGLADAADSQLFEQKATAFMAKFKAKRYGTVAHHFAKNWRKDAAMWAAFGRQSPPELPALCVDTNNHLEA